MKFSLLSLAADELATAVEYYEDAQKGLGIQFLNSFEKSIQRILANPRAWTMIGNRCRKCLVDRFPYGIIYTETEFGILVLAIMHLSKKPEYWKERPGRFAGLHHQREPASIPADQPPVARPAYRA